MPSGIPYATNPARSRTEVVETPSEAAWAGLDLALSGTATRSRGMGHTEVRYPTIVVTAPWELPVELPGRDLNHFIGAAEACSLIGQVSVPEHLVRRVKAFDKYREDDGLFWGAYGPRAFGQIRLAAEALRDDEGSRQAVVTIYDGHRDLGRSVRDVPCTLSIQFMVRARALECRVTMRSNDAFLGLPYDLTQFILLQAAMARHLSLDMGPYIHQPGSLHLYDSDQEAARKVGAPIWDGEEYPPPYRPLWGGLNLGEIGEWCRDALEGRAVPRTWLEEWIVEALT